MVARAFRTEDVFVSLQEPSLYTVKAILILDNDGDRLFAKVRVPFRLVEKQDRVLDLGTGPIHSYSSTNNFEKSSI